MPSPQIQITIDGKAFAHQQALQSLRINDYFGVDAQSDDLQLTIAAANFAKPSRGVVIAVALGLDDQLHKKGEYLADEFEQYGPPHMFSIRAHAANLRQSLKQQRELNYNYTTIGEVLSAIAKRNSLIPIISPTIAGIDVLHLDQQESDLHLITRLASDYSHRANIKYNHLVVMPRNATKSITGLSLPVIDIDYAHIIDYRLTETDRNNYSGVQSHWYTKHCGKKQRYLAGKDGYVYTLQNNYAKEQQAIAAAHAKWESLQSAITNLEITMRTPALAAQAGHLAMLQDFDSINLPTTGWRIEKQTIGVSQGKITQLLHLYK